MKSKIIALTTAAAIATTSLTAAPTQASEADNLLKAIVGVAVLGAVINAASQPSAAVTTRRPATVVRVNPRQRVVVRYRSNPPRSCLFKKWSRHGWKTFYGRKCMRHQGWAWDTRGWYKTRIVFR